MRYGIAIDIGTTTIGAALVTLPEGAVAKEASCMNAGRMTGADVISRIKAAADGSLFLLQDMMRKDLTTLISSLVTAETAQHVERVVIAANTTMLHILRGYSCAGLGTWPYTPVTLSSETLPVKEVLPALTFLPEAVSVVLFPGFAPFVGADITAGVYSLIASPSSFLLLDLGTNGEMALVQQGRGNTPRITVCSTAAGPVFEGGGIRCGMGGVAGAIAHVRLDSSPSISIIGGDTGDIKPHGLCGTAVLELVSELRRTGIVDETGLMKEPYFKLGYPVVSAAESATGARIALTQDDIRAVQMAKAAIRAGIITLLQAAGCSFDDIDTVFVAGGYGQHMDFAAIRPLSMVPDAMLPKCVSAGNTSLAGCIALLRDFAVEGDDALKKADALTHGVTEVILAQEDGFESLYYDSMNL